MIDSLKRRFDYYKGALSSIHAYGGSGELARAMTRMALRKPSDAWRLLRWNQMSKMAERVIVRFPKFELMLDARDKGIAAELSMDRMHEPIGTEVLLDVLKDGMTIIELGANIGYFTMQEARQVKLKRIVAIEPNPVNFELLNQNVALNNCDNVDTFNIGISDIDDSLPFYITKHSNICSFVARDDYDRVIDVPVMRLDTFIKREKIKDVSLIRMDIEGYEINALRGMQDVLKRDKPWISMEYHAPVISAEDREGFIASLEALDYELKCFMFRWSDYPIFGKTIVNRETVLMRGDLRKVLTDIQNQVLMLFLAPKSTPFEWPDL